MNFKLKLNKLKTSVINQNSTTATNRNIENLQYKNGPIETLGVKIPGNENDHVMYYSINN